jgi:hypothetical protein
MKLIRSDMCKNLEYISLFQSRAMLAEPSKMHRNRPLAVYPATVYILKLHKKHSLYQNSAFETLGSLTEDKEDSSRR